MSLSCLTHIENHIAPIFANSARLVNTVGNYHGCLDTQGMNYFAVSLADLKGNPFGGMAFCLPEECSNNSVKEVLSYLLQKASIPFSVTDVNSNIPDITYPYDFRFFLTVFIIFMLISLVLLSSTSKTVRNHKFFSIFSLQNSLKIYKYQDNRLNTFNGIKAISMFWVILGHTYSFSITGTVNIFTLQLQFQNWFALIIEAGLYAVDTFFFVGGFLMAYAILKEKSTTLLKYPLAILNRYLRFIPAYVFTILLYSSIYIHLGSGPLWSQNLPAVSMCNSLWKSLFFVDNFVENGGTMCLGWTWYLQNDMQIFVYCTLVLFVYRWNKFGSYILIVWSMIASYAFYMIRSYELGAHYWVHVIDFATTAQYMLDIYTKPYARCAPYLYGLLLGIMYSRFLEEEKKADSNHAFVRLKNKMMKNKKWKNTIELLGLIIVLFVIFIPRTAQNDHHWSQFAHSFYLTYAKTFFVMGLSILILPSLLGIDSIVRFILDTKFFNFVAKASYCTYLIHLVFLYLIILSRKVDFYFGIIPLLSHYATFSVVNIFLGFVMTLLVQIPCAKLQKMLLTFLFEKAVGVKRQKVKENDDKNQGSSQKIEGPVINESIKESLK